MIYVFALNQIDTHTRARTRAHTHIYIYIYIPHFYNYYGIYEDNNYDFIIKL